MPDDHYRPDHASMGRYLRGPEVRRLLRELGERGEAYATAVAPRRSGRYSASFDLHDATGYDGRAAVDLVAGVEYADEVERRHHVLKRTGQMLEAGD